MDGGGKKKHGLKRILLTIMVCAWLVLVLLQLGTNVFRELGKEPIVDRPDRIGEQYKGEGTPEMPSSEDLNFDQGEAN